MRVCLSTLLSVYFFLIFATPLFAQESVEPLVIETPTSQYVERSFTISGTAQAGAKLHLSINGKTFGRYRADIGGKFTIGVSVPEDVLSVKLAHLIDEKVHSSVTLELKVGVEKAIVKPTESKKNEPETTEKWSTKEEKRQLPSAEKIPKAPEILDAKRTNEKEAPIDQDPVIRRNSPAEYAAERQPNTQDESSMFNRVLLETVGLAVVTTALFTLTYFVIEETNSPELVLFYLAAQIALAPIGTYVGGNLAGGQADLWPVYVGELVGLAGTFAFISTFDSVGGTTEDVLFTFALLSPFIGMVIGYELSHSVNVAKGKTLTFIPTLNLSSEVKTLGFGMRF